ncbi:MAG TPA: ABC transporter substrate-binding protein [Nitrososphaeraceae archaeon]|nr:ABC transporter substrate-binding protein [Nitrososphaeraceae archaeon]
MNAKGKLIISTIIIVAVIVSSIFYSDSSSLFVESVNDNTQNSGSSQILRIGYFPNINHAQAVIGLGNGTFQKALGDNIEVKTTIFNAGPSAMEALFAKQVDVTYVGPNPAINAYVVSQGKDVRIISGASSGGAVFVVRNDSGIQSTKDFANKKFASPQLGNTQDVALRKYLLDNGYKTKENGGNVEVVYAKPSDILTLMLKKEIDGAWAPEPWGARLIKEANARIFLDERDLWPPKGQFVTSNIVARTDYLQSNPDVIKKLLTAHVDETEWINSHKEEAIQAFNVELKKLTGQAISEDQLRGALSRLELTYDPVKESLFQSANSAFDIGFLGKTRPDLSGIYDLDLLNAVIAEREKETIK